MIAAPAKFTFDLDLGHRQERNSVVTESAMQALLTRARAEGYEEGLAAGEHGATARTAHAAETLADHVATMHAALDDARQANLSEAVGLAAAIGRKLAVHLLTREPTAEIEALITECLASLDNVPHLVIRCHPDLADRVREIATARIATSGFSGRLVVLGDPDLSPGDGRIEWADGGLVRDFAIISQEIDTRIAAFLAASGAPRLDEENP